MTYCGGNLAEWGCRRRFAGECVIHYEDGVLPRTGYLACHFVNALHAYPRLRANGRLCRVKHRVHARIHVLCVRYHFVGLVGRVRWRKHGVELREPCTRGVLFGAFVPFCRLSVSNRPKEFHGWLGKVFREADTTRRLWWTTFVRTEKMMPRRTCTRGTTEGAIRNSAAENLCLYVWRRPFFVHCSWKIV